MICFAICLPHCTVSSVVADVVSYLFLYLYYPQRGLALQSCSAKYSSNEEKSLQLRNVSVSLGWLNSDYLRRDCSQAFSVAVETLLNAICLVPILYITCIRCWSEDSEIALARWLTWLERHPIHQKVAGSIPSQGIYRILPCIMCTFLPKSLRGKIRMRIIHG